MILFLISILVIINSILIVLIIINKNNKIKETYNNIIVNEFKLNQHVLNNIKNNYNNMIDIPIYYINLDRSTDRKKYMEDQFKYYNITNYNRISAIDGKKIQNTSKGFIDNIKYVNNYNKLTAYEIACTLSHLKTINLIDNNNNDYALILEDDCSLDLITFWKDNLLNLINKNIPKDWEIVQLFSFNCYDLSNNIYYTKHVIGNECTSTLAYIINKLAIKKIMNYIYPDFTLGKYINNNLFPKIGAADNFIYDLVNTYNINIPLFYPNIILDSTIHTEHLLYQTSQTNKILNYYISNQNNKIPKIIHQTWKTESLPDCYDRWSKNIKEMHPGWEYKLWTDKDNRNFIKENYSWFLDIYDNYDKNIKRVDAVRYFLLYHYGGIYIDMDMTTIKKLDSLIYNTKNSIFGYQLPNKEADGSIANAFMISPPKHSLFKYLILNLSTTKDKPVLEATGPSYLTNAIKNYKNKDITVYDFPIIYSTEWNTKDSVLECDYNIELCVNKFPNCYLITFWTGSWIENNLKYKLEKYIPAKLNIKKQQLIPYNIFKILLLDENELPLVPEYLFNSINSWKILNPEYNIFLFDKNDCINFLKKNFDTNVLKAFNFVKPFSYKCDLMRLCLLYIYGGIYSDIRMTLLKPLKNIIKEDIDFICSVDKNNNNISPLANGFLAAIPKHLFIKKSIDTIVNNILNKYYGDTPLDPTGPTAFGLTINKIINNGQIIKTPFLAGIYNFKNYKYELLNLKFINKDKVFITQNNDEIILVKPKKDKIDTDFKNSNVYWEMWKNKDIYN
jgi:mannosyltransferase OCH1-like enzyme